MGSQAGRYMDGWREETVLDVVSEAVAVHLQSVLHIFLREKSLVQLADCQGRVLGQQAYCGCPIAQIMLFMNGDLIFGTSLSHPKIYI